MKRKYTSQSIKLKALLATGNMCQVSFNEKIEILKEHDMFDNETMLLPMYEYKIKGESDERAIDAFGFVTFRQSTKNITEFINQAYAMITDKD